MRWPDEQIVLLAKCRLRALAIHFGRRSDYNRHLVLRGSLQQQLGFVQVRLQHMNRRAHHQFDSHRRRKVVNGFGVMGQLVQFATGGDFRLQHAQPRVACHAAQILQAAG